MAGKRQAANPPNSRRSPAVEAEGLQLDPQNLSALIRRIGLTPQAFKRLLAFLLIAYAMYLAHDAAIAFAPRRAPTGKIVLVYFPDGDARAKENNPLMLPGDLKEWLEQLNP